MEKILSNQLVQFDKWTQLIIDTIPLDINSLIFTGNLLTKSYLKSYGLKKKTKNKFEEKELEYVDLYLFGPSENKKQIFHKIISNLKEKLKYTVLVGDTMVGTIKSNQIKIIIQLCPRIIRINNVNVSKPDDIISSFPFAHELLYWSNQGLYVSPFALFSIKQKKLMPNPMANNRASLTQLESIFRFDFNTTEYINDFHIIKNPTEDELEFSAFKTFFSKNSKSSNLVFNFIDAHGLKIIKLTDNDEINSYLKLSIPMNNPNENFLDDKYQIVRHKFNYYSGTLFVNNLSKIILNVQVYEVIKVSYAYISRKNINYYLMSITNPNSIEKLKSSIGFCIRYFMDLSLPYYQTCILNSEILTDEEKKFFNTDSTCIFHNLEETNKAWKKIFPHIKNKNKQLYFLAESKNPIKLATNIPIVFSIETHVFHPHSGFVNIIANKAFDY